MRAISPSNRSRASSFFLCRRRQVGSEEFQRPLPRGLVGFRTIALPAGAIKTMGRVIVIKKFMLFAEAIQFGVELVHFLRRRAGIEHAEMALNRTGDIGRERRGRGSVAAPFRI